jgi:hypothetical protein
MLDQAEIDNRFTYHPPTPTRVMLHTGIREALKEVATRFNEHLPAGRELATALTKLEEAMFWANAALARELPAE